jgi:hypothetical protein
MTRVQGRVESRNKEEEYFLPLLVFLRFFSDFSLFLQAPADRMSPRPLSYFSPMHLFPGILLISILLDHLHDQDHV